MPGQELTGTATSTGNAVLPTHQHHSSLTAQLVDHTPTTSMLAALHDSNGTQQGTSSTQGAHHHPLASSTTFDAPFSFGSVECGSFSGYGSSFDMSFFNGAHDVPVEQAHSSAAQSVGSSASVADLSHLTVGVAATGVGDSEAGESPVPGRRGSDEKVDVKHENL